MRYAVAALIYNAFVQHRAWRPVWRHPDPRPSYDVVIVGAGGHGLATAYYLAKEHSRRNVAVVEKGWLGGGNTGRNTTVIRSNCLWDESTALYAFYRLFPLLRFTPPRPKAVNQPPGNRTPRPPPAKQGPAISRLPMSLPRLRRPCDDRNGDGKRVSE